jgi:hypothetical protein
MTTNTMMDLEEVGGGVRYRGKFYPYRHTALSLPGKRNSRYYVKSFTVTGGQNDAKGDCASGFAVVQDTVTSWIYVRCPATAVGQTVAVNGGGHIGILFDRGANLDIFDGITFGSVHVVYAEVDDS